MPLCGRTTPADSTSYSWAGAPGPFPPASGSVNPPHTYTGPYCARPGMTNQINWDSNTAFVNHNGNASNQQHWTQVMCGHEIQINESLTGGGPNPSSDPIKTGSVYGFRNLNAQQSRTYERLEKGVWHEMEIRMVGQQYTVLVDGRIINQFDNSVPKVATRTGDPATAARQFARGYLGLQTHGGNDRINYREIQIKELTPAVTPVNTVAPTVTGTGFVGQNLTCNTGTWTPATGVSFSRRWYRSNKIGPEHPRFRAPSQIDLGNFSTPADANGLYGNQNLTWLDSLPGRRGRQQHLLADPGRRGQDDPLRAGRRHRRCHGLEDRGRARDPGGRDADRRRRRAGDDEPHARRAGVVRQLHARRGA